MKVLGGLVAVIVGAFAVVYFMWGRSFLWEREFDYVRTACLGAGNYEEAHDGAQKLLKAPTPDQKWRAELLSRQIAILNDPDGQEKASDVVLRSRGTRQWHGTRERVELIEIENRTGDAIEVSDEYFIAMRHGCGFATRRGGVGIPRTDLPAGHRLRGTVVFTAAPASLSEPMHLYYVDASRYVHTEAGESKGMFNEGKEAAVEVQELPE